MHENIAENVTTKTTTKYRSVRAKLFEQIHLLGHSKKQLKHDNLSNIVKEHISGMARKVMSNHSAP